MKLVSMAFNSSPRIPGIRPGEPLKLDQPGGGAVGWRAILRGPTVFLVSPPGWRPGTPPSQFEKNGPSTVWEMPRTNCLLEWSGVESDMDEIAKGKFVTPPFGPPPAPAEEPKRLLDQVPA